MNEKDKLLKFKTELDSIGSGFCLAKWTQVTIHLHNGTTHSCHHPKTHKIPKLEVDRNPSALHNTRYKKRQRLIMLKGERPDECDYCWNVEDTSNEFSDRIYKSNENWSKPYFEEIKNSNWREDYVPKYVEVSFSNTCNFKCSYCGPIYSSQWVQEMKKYGAYPTSTLFNDIRHLEATKSMPYLRSEENPYISAFWKWWPEMYQQLHTFRITGGEPLLSKDTWKLLDYIIDIDDPNTNLILGINSNLGVSNELIEKLVNKISHIESNNLVKEVILYTSCDTWGPQSEYIRHGLKYDEWYNNLKFILSKLKKVSIVVMSTFNALSIPNYEKFLIDIFNLKKEFNSDTRYWSPSVFLDSSYLRFPTHQSVRILPMDWSYKIDEIVNMMEKLRNVLGVGVVDKWNPLYMGFTDIEIDKIKRIAEWMRSSEDDNKLQNQLDFYKFIREHDFRRKTDFKETFPELIDFYEFCKTITL